MSEQKRDAILLVEDQALIAISEQQSLERHGFEVRVAHSGDRAVEIAASFPEIGLVLMDIDLGPGMDGTEAAQQILAAREVPIVFLTGHSERDMVERVRGITRYGYVMKNSGEFVLIQAIQMARELYRSHREMADEIEARRRTEAELRERNSFIQTILDNLPIGLAVNYEQEGTATYVNRRFEQIYGWPRDALTDIPSFFEHVYPDPEYRAQIVERVMTDIASGDAERMQWADVEITREDGTTAFVSAKNIPIPGQNFMISTVQDTTAHVEAIRWLRETRLALRAAVQKLELAIHTARVGVWEYDLQTERLEWNAVMREIHGMPEDDEPTMERWWSMVHPDDYERAHATLSRVADGEPVEDLRFRVVRPDGEVRSVIAASRPVYSNDRLVSLVGINVDETETRATRESLEAALAETSLLVSETNHRIKNNLLTVATLLDLAETESGADLSKVKNQLEAIRNVHALILRSKDERTVELRPYVDAIVAAVVGHLDRSAVEPGVEVDDLTLEPRAAIPFGLIVNELVTNAVRHGVTDGDPLHLGVMVVRDGGACRIEVSNDGPTIPEEFTLDEPPSMGLRLVKALTRQLDGTLDLARRPKTAFTVTFPLDR